MALRVGSFGFKAAACFQVFLGTGSLLTLAFYPPLHGRMLLVPIDGTPVSAALTDELMLYRVKDGPLPGSVLVDGPGRIIGASLLRKGVIPLGAPPALCGANPPDRGIS
jgi:hypothetical protein